jgi:hypothetical protein
VEFDEETRAAMKHPKGRVSAKRWIASRPWIGHVEDFAEKIEAMADEYDLDFARQKGFYAFLEYVTDLRMSKEGRFYRVHYVTGEWVDVVPPGSLASGEKLVHDGRRKGKWRFVRPSIDKLWREFQAENGKTARAK